MMRRDSRRYGAQAGLWGGTTLAMPCWRSLNKETACQRLLSTFFSPPSGQTCACLSRRASDKHRAREPRNLTHELLGSVPGRTDFSRIFIFGPPDFFADFLRDFFLVFVAKKSAQKNPRFSKNLQNLYSKNPRHISAEGPGQELSHESAHGNAHGSVHEDVTEMPTKVEVFFCV